MPVEGLRFAFASEPVVVMSIIGLMNVYESVCWTAVLARFADVISYVHKESNESNGKHSEVH